MSFLSDKPAMGHTIFCSDFWLVKLDGINNNNFEENIVNWLDSLGCDVCWNDVGVVFCRLNKDIDFLLSSDILLFGNENEFMTYNTLDDTRRKNILFVYFDEPGRTLYLLGNITFRAYKTLTKDTCFITIADLDRYFTRQYNSQSTVMKFEPYLNVSQKDFEQINVKYKPCILSIDTMYQRRLYSHACSKAGKCTKSLPNEGQYPKGYKKIAFFFALIIASANQKFYDVLLSEERKMMELRYILMKGLSLDQWLSFVSDWFPGVVSVIEALHGKYFCENELYFNTKLQKVTANQRRNNSRLWSSVLKFHKKHYPDEGISPVMLVASTEYMPEFLLEICPICKNPNCDTSLPIEKGKIVFTINEMEFFMKNYLDKLIETQVRQIQETTLINHFAVLLKTEDNYFYGVDDLFSQTIVSISERILESNKGRKKQTPIHDVQKELIDNILPKYEQLIALISNVTKNKKQATKLARYTMSFVLELDIIFEQDSLDLELQRTNYNNKPNNNPKMISNHVFPTTYSELIRYAHFYWPPCIRSLVELSKGDRHLVFEERLKICAFMRMSGYDEEQANHLWYLLFSETTIVKPKEGNVLNYNEFMDSDYGRIPQYDREANKTVGVAISCKSMITKKLCPYTTREVTDIEDLLNVCRLGCTKELSSSFKNNANIFPISSPLNYFYQSKRKTNGDFK